MSNGQYRTRCYSDSYSIYDANGKEIIYCKKEIELLPNGQYRTHCYSDSYSIYDTNGKEIIYCEKEIEFLSNGQYRTHCYSDSYSIYDASGKRIIYCEKEVELLSNGQYRTRCYSDSYSLYDASGKQIINCENIGKINEKLNSHTTSQQTAQQQQIKQQRQQIARKGVQSQTYPSSYYKKESNMAIWLIGVFFAAVVVAIICYQLGSRHRASCGDGDYHYREEMHTTEHILCFFFGIFGIHRFYMGEIILGIITLLITVVGLILISTGYYGGGIVMLLVLWIWAIFDFFRRPYYDEISGYWRYW